MWKLDVVFKYNLKSTVEVQTAKDLSEVKINMQKTAAVLYKEREKRINDAIQLKEPDRVPIWFHDTGFFPAKYAGLTFQDAMYNIDKLFTAYKKTMNDFEPDAFSSPYTVVHVPGEAHDMLGVKQVKWPGHGVSPYHTFQFVEGEYMKANEYDIFLDDPTDFTIRYYLPRILGTMSPLSVLPPIKTFLSGYFGLSPTAAFASKEVADAFESFHKAGLSIQKHINDLSSFHQDMKALGFPLSFGSGALAPFDLISDMLRGMRGLMLDMYKQPDKVLAAIDKVTPMMIAQGSSSARSNGSPIVFITLHRGAHGFMSLKQFETFYWPSLKKLMLALIDRGQIPCPFFEGDYTSRLEYLTELPKGKVIGQFDTTDPVKAKEIVGDTMCMAGMMPLSLLQMGTPDKVKKYTKKLIDVVGKGGGFIMGPRGSMDECNPELVKVWVDFTKQYGVYK
jgi:uroporphyrinogen-III decarboxylase